MAIHPLLWLPLMIIQTIPTIVIEASLVYLFIGANSTTWGKYGGNLVGAISIACIVMVYIYDSPWWRALLAKNITIVNFSVFCVANFFLAFVNYFVELGCILLVDDRPFE